MKAKKSWAMSAQEKEKKKLLTYRFSCRREAASIFPPVMHAKQFHVSPNTRIEEEEPIWDAKVVRQHRGKNFTHLQRRLDFLTIFGAIKQKSARKH